MATQPDDMAPGEGEVEFSLADLAGVDASDIQEVRFENLPPGAYDFIGRGAKLEEMTNREDKKRFVLTLTMEVVECKVCLERGVEKESLVGKKHIEKMYILPENPADGIGRIRALYADIGLDNRGPLGGVEGQAPGFIDTFVDHVFPGKIKHKPRKDDPGTKDARLQIDAPKK